jgi:hypothetical protein
MDKQCQMTVATPKDNNKEERQNTTTNNKDINIEQK